MHYLEMVFEPPIEQEGVYEFSFLYRGETVSCTATLLFTEGRPLSCSSVTDDGRDINGYIISGEGSHGIAGINVAVAPASFDFSIRRDGVEISRTTHRPSYETWYPNGEECDGESGGCRQATAHVDL